MNTPLAYLLTFRTYGTWLHGDARGSMQHSHCRSPFAPALAPNHRWRVDVSRTMADGPRVLSVNERRVVHAAIVEVCAYRGWNLLALNVRTNHVYAVLGTGEAPERAVTTLKAWSTRRLREGGSVGVEARVWARHGSTRYLWGQAAVEGAVSYVVEWQ